MVNWSIELCSISTIKGIGFITVSSFLFAVLSCVAQWYTISITQLLLGMLSIRKPNFNQITVCLSTERKLDTCTICTKCFIHTLLASCDLSYKMHVCLYDVNYSKENSPKPNPLFIYKYFTQLVLSTIWIVVKRPSSITHWYGERPYIGNIWLRGGFQFLSNLCLWIALRVLPLGDTQCIHYLAPFFTVSLACIILKESLPRVYIVTCLLPIGALILIAQPDFIFNGEDGAEQLNTAGVISVAISVFGWVGCVLIVRTALSAHFLQLNLVTSSQIVLFWIPMLFIFTEFVIDIDKYEITRASKFNSWSWDRESVVVLIFIGLLGYIAVLCSVRGYQLAQATKIGYFEYLDVFFSFILQAYLEGYSPNALSIGGLCLVIAVCMAHFFEELYKSALNGRTISDTTEIGYIESEQELQGLLSEIKTKN